MFLRDIQAKSGMVGNYDIHETVVAKTQVIQRLKADKHCFSHQSLFYMT